MADPFRQDPLMGHEDNPDEMSAAATSHKRTLESDEYRYLEGEPEDGDDASELVKKKRRKGNPPPKKLNNEQWDLMFNRLIEYKNEHGDTLVPKRYQADPKLGTWVETQRMQYKRLPRVQDEEGTETVTPNKRLNPERLERLASAGFIWSARNVKKTKPSAVPAKATKKPPSSAEATARAAARQKQSDANWNDMYNRLVEYKGKYGDCLVPKKYEQDPKLGTWVEAQRVLYNRDHRKVKAEPSPSSAATTAATLPAAKTPEEWAADLEKSGDAAADEEVAATMAEAAMEVVDEVAPPPQAVGLAESATAMDEAAMGDSNALAAPKRLSQERKDKLDGLGFVWSLRSKRVDDHWDDMFKQLVEYKEKHGDCLVPSRYEENFKLGKWVETQRYEYTKLQRVASAETAATGSEEGEGTGKSRPTNPRLTEDRRRRLEEIGFEWKVKHKMRRYYDRQWDVMHTKLLKYKEENGHCLVPKRYPPDPKLGTWVHTQRIQHRKTLTENFKKEEVDEKEEKADGSEGEDDRANRLTDDRFRRLEEAGFVWSARETEKKPEARINRNSYDDQWDAMFERLRSYKEQNGDCLVPKRYTEDPKLGTWCDTQRVQYKKMRKALSQKGVDYEGPGPVNASESGSVNSDGPENAAAPKPIVGRLTDDRISRLEGLGFIWSLRDDWQKHYNELVEFKNKNGHCNVPARYPENRRLGIWVSAQRQQYKLKIAAPEDDTKQRRAAPLTEERIDLLNQLGFTWTIRSRDTLGESWNTRLEELRQYKEENGDCLVPSRWHRNPELGVWVGTQRTQYRLYMKASAAGKAATLSSAMNEDRIRQLEDIGFVWAMREGTDGVWKKRISELEQFRAMYGHTAVPSLYGQNPKLGSWASDVRTQYALRQRGNSTLLDDEKIAELDMLGFSWEEPQVFSSDLMSGEAAHAAAEAIDGSAPIELSGVDEEPDTLTLHEI